MAAPTQRRRLSLCAKALGCLVLTVVANPAASGDRRINLSGLVELSDEIFERAGLEDHRQELGWLRRVDELGQRQGLAFQIGGVVSGSGFGLGVEHTVWRDENEALGWRALRTHKGYQDLGVFYRRRFDGAAGAHFRVGIDRLELPQERFYGFGADSARASRADFRLTETRVRSALSWDLDRQFTMFTHGTFRHVRTGAGTDDAFPPPNEVFGEAMSSGYGSSVAYGGFGLGVAWDGRDRPGYARRGAMVSGEIEQWFGLSHNAPPYRRYAAELQYVLPLPGHDHRLATRVRADWLDRSDRSTGGAGLPFFLSSGLGGSRSLRSFSLDRFRGESVALATVEYRAAILRDELEAVLFWDTGGADAEFGDFSPATLRQSFGAGIRLLRRDDVFLRLDVAYGAEGTRFIVSFGRSF